jgi:Iron/manganese superoxide dismutases, alpha-hairpin domain/Iron/manganese superoxide dismutases, C-terminal domain
MAYEVPPLPYPYDALEPHIDEQTMHLHHDKHHQAYVDNANKALEGTEWADRPVEEVLANLEILPDDKRTAVQNNAGGHYNHSLFWEIMSPDGGGEPSGSLAAAIESTFEGLDQLKEQVNDAGVKRFGSGTTALGWPWSRPRTRTHRSPTGRRRSSASMSGSTPTTSSIRTGGPSTSGRGGTSSTGAPCSSATTRPAGAERRGGGSPRARLPPPLSTPTSAGRRAASRSPRPGTRRRPRSPA